MPQVMEPMQLQLGYMLFTDQRIRHLFPDAAQEHFIAYGEVEMHVSIGIDAAGGLNLTLQMRGVRVFHAAELGPGSLLMRYGPLRLVNWLSWLTDNVVAAARLPWGKAPGSYWPVPVFLGPEFEDDEYGMRRHHGVFGLDHSEFHLMAVSFINGTKKPKAVRRVPYVARLEMEHPDSRPARVLGASAGELTVRRTRYNPSRYEYQSYEETVPAFNADAIGVVLDRLQETGQAMGGLAGLESSQQGQVILDHLLEKFGEAALVEALADYIEQFFAGIHLQHRYVVPGQEDPTRVFRWLGSFANGYGASIIAEPGTGRPGGERLKFELAVTVRGATTNQMAPWLGTQEVTFKTPITSDVLRWRTPREIAELLLAIASLPPVKS